MIRISPPHPRVNPRHQTTGAEPETPEIDLDQREALVRYVWEEVTRRSDGRALRPAEFQAIADEIIAEREDPASGPSSPFSITAPRVTRVARLRSAAAVYVTG
jgi:hypothetical protein